MIGATSNASATTIYTETFIPNTASPSDADTSQYIANDFVPVVDGTITDVTWKGFYYSTGSPQAADDFTINFYSDSASSVGGLLGSFNAGNSVNRTGTGQFFGGSEFFSYQVDLGAGLDVLSGSSYWISIFNDTTVDSDDNWYWATNTLSTGPGQVRNESVDLTTWSNSTPWPYYFELADNSTDVPEPTPIALMILGLAGLGFNRRRRKHST